MKKRQQTNCKLYHLRRNDPHQDGCHLKKDMMRICTAQNLSIGLYSAVSWNIWFPRMSWGSAFIYMYQASYESWGLKQLRSRLFA
jgi:hypothetical protein